MAPSLHSNKSKSDKEFKRAFYGQTTTRDYGNDSWSPSGQRPIGYAAPGKIKSRAKNEINVSIFDDWGLTLFLYRQAIIYKKRLALLFIACAGFVFMGSRGETLPQGNQGVLHLEAIDLHPRLASFAQISPNETGLFHELSFVGQKTEREWVHPTAGPRILPDKRTRIFGAHRDGERPAECGAGHCGVDLVGEIGTPIRAVLGGTVLRANHNPEANGGKYIKIAHGERILSYYMHLDTLAKGLKHGSVVAAGDIIGTLGDTDIETSPPHLHFSVATLDSRGGRLYVDPLPMLKQARSY